MVFKLREQYYKRGEGQYITTGLLVGPGEFEWPSHNKNLSICSPRRDGTSAGVFK